ncbi:DUF1573 domain-containing protein [Candidatus Woesearchaeota archaeon]|nr:DUF1573 domain-containing protein [Candidatus Woesearchaeota archaeon]MBT5740235.1 DUF1573 domain-containing protein [Candidatus Woesearchaeota archaeon]
MVRCDICERDFSSQDALDMHNKHKHKEIEKKVRKKLTTKQKKKIRNYSIALITLLVIIALIYWKVVPPEDAPLINVNTDSLNFGAVSQARGTVSKEVTITNEGKTDLIINEMDTSCGCTSATLVQQGQESPRFSMSMHGTNPRNFEMLIPPGDSAQLKIQYDPNVHREMRGAVTRSVYIMSNDPTNSREEVRIHVNQVD